MTNRVDECRPNRVHAGSNRRNLANIKCTNLNPHKAQRIRFAHWNARSLNAKNKSGHKSAALCDFVIDNQVDLLALTETWFTGDFQDNRAIADINCTLPIFSLHHLPCLS